MKRTSRFLLMSSLLTLSACGGGTTAGGGNPGGGGNGGGGGSANASYSAGRISGATIAPTGTFYDGTVKIDGFDTVVLKAFSDDSVYSDGTHLFRYQPGANSASFSLIGYDYSGNYLGEYLFAASSAPTSGTATYVGTYKGNAFGPYGDVIISGTSNLTANFSSGVFDGSISGRFFGHVDGYDNDELASNIAFSGVINGNGVMTGSHSDGNSSGTVNAVADSSGVVGTVNVDHFGASLYSPADLLEVGTFVGTK